MSESNENTQKNRGRVARLAQWFLDFLNDHPVLKLLAIVWIIITSIWVPVDTWLRQRAESRRAGLDYTSSVRLQLDGNGHCQLTNTGNRGISEVTLQWNGYTVVNATEFRASMMTFQAKPAAQAHDLIPSGVLETTYHADLREMLCQGVRPIPGVCPPGHDCHIAVECEARYHRAADLLLYKKSEFILLESGCKSIVPLKTLVGIKKEQLVWKDERYRNVWRSLQRERSRQKAPMQQYDDFHAKLDELLQQEQ